MSPPGKVGGRARVRKAAGRGKAGDSGSTAALRKRLRQTERRLREVEQRYDSAMAAMREQVALTQAIIEQIPGAVFAKDREGRFTHANRGWSEMSGVPAQRAIGRTVHDLYPAEAAKRFAAEDRKLIARGAGAPPVESVHEGPRPHQYRIVHKAVLSGADGAVRGIVCTSTDISELKRVEAELANRAKFIGDLVDELPVSVALRDTEGRFVQVNRAWERYFDLRREHVLGKRFDELPGGRESPDLAAGAKAASAPHPAMLAPGPATPPQPPEQL